MNEKNIIDAESNAVTTHMSMLQSVISRMAANSSACKTWCITLVSAILVLAADKNRPECSLIALLPTILFCGLDNYYLALERSFRGGYDALLEKVAQNILTRSELYQIKPDNNLRRHFLNSLRSPAIYPFYSALCLLQCQHH